MKQPAELINLKAQWADMELAVQGIAHQMQQGQNQIAQIRNQQQPILIQIDKLNRAAQQAEQQRAAKKTKVPPLKNPALNPDAPLNVKAE